MLKKTFLGLVLTGLLAVPVGIALANDTTEDVTPVTIEKLDRDQTRDQLGDQDRVQDRVQDPSVCNTCPRLSDDPLYLDDLTVPDDVTGDQERDRDRLRDMDCQDGQLRFEQAQERQRMQLGPQNHSGVAARFGAGPGWDE